jgi:hypothetical protein
VYKVRLLPPFAVKLKIFADTGRENICGKYFCGWKIILLLVFLISLAVGTGTFSNRNIITTNIFSSRIRKFFGDDGKQCIKYDYYFLLNSV